MKTTIAPKRTTLAPITTTKSLEPLAVRTGVRSGFRNSSGDYDFANRR